MIFEDKLHDIIKTLETGKLLLAPAEFAWSIVSIDEKELKRKKIEILRDYSMVRSTLYVTDIEMIKKCIPDIHPRIETLLSYHRRPMCISYVDDDGNNGTACIAFDPYIHRIIELLQAPLHATYWYENNEPTLDFENLDSKILSATDYHAFHNRNKKLHGHFPVNISYDEIGNLTFL